MATATLTPKAVPKNPELHPSVQAATATVRDFQKKRDEARNCLARAIRDLQAARDRPVADEATTRARLLLQGKSLDETFLPGPDLDALEREVDKWERNLAALEKTVALAEQERHKALVEARQLVVSQHFLPIFAGLARRWTVSLRDLLEVAEEIRTLREDVEQVGIRAESFLPALEMTAETVAAHRSSDCQITLLRLIQKALDEAQKFKG
jgi:hypothetical protein